MVQAYIWVVPWNNHFRFEVYSPDAEENPLCVRHDVCDKVPVGAIWYCENFDRRAFCEQAVRAAFPEVEDLRWERAALLIGDLPLARRLQGVIAVEQAVMEAKLRPVRCALAECTRGRVVDVEA